jgi:ParB-like chromosome segregation protein Spo0J
MIIAGEGIWRALSELNLPCAVRLWDIDQKTADAYMLADNEHPKGATDDEDRVAAILREIEASEYGALGFSEKEARRLLGGGDDAALEILEVPIETVADQFWISLRGPLKDQASTLQELRKLMAKYPNVQIEIGTLELAS